LDKRISAGAFRLWHYLNDRKNKSAHCWPTQRQIASEDQRRQKTAARVRKFRENNDKTTPVTHGNAPVTHGNAGNAMQREREKQKDNLGGELNPPALSIAEKISLEKELERIISELAKLGSPCDYPANSSLNRRISELRQRQSEIRKVLGVMA
jgi:hypothetical protein